MRRYSMLLAALLLLTALTGCGREEPEEPPKQESAAWVSPTPAPTAEPTPEPTAEPTPEPTAEPTPEPPAEPTVPPEPSKAPGEVIATGSAESDTGTALKLKVDWEAVAQEDGRMKLNVKGTVQSYTLQITSRNVTVEFDGQTETCTGAAIFIEEADAPIDTELFSTSLEADSDAVGTLKVTWDYRGTYSNVELPEITVEASVS